MGCPDSQFIDQQVHLVWFYHRVDLAGSFHHIINIRSKENGEELEKTASVCVCRRHTVCCAFYPGCKTRRSSPLAVCFSDGTLVNIPPSPCSNLGEEGYLAG